MLIHTQRLCKQQKDNVPYCKRQKGVNPRALSWLEKVGAIDTKSPFNSILSTDAPQVQGLGSIWPSGLSPGLSHDWLCSMHSTSAVLPG